MRERAPRSVTFSTAFNYVIRLESKQALKPDSIRPMAELAPQILRLVATPLSWENDSVRPVALRPRLSASLPFARVDSSAAARAKSSFVVVFSRHSIRRQESACAAV